MPSWTTVATTCPARLKTCPAPRARDSEATGDAVEYSTQSEKSTGLWNHTEWSIVTAKMRSHPHDSPCVVMIESSTVVSEE